MRTTRTAANSTSRLLRLSPRPAVGCAFTGAHETTGTAPRLSRSSCVPLRGPADRRRGGDPPEGDGSARGGQGGGAGVSGAHEAENAVVAAFDQLRHPIGHVREGEP